MSLAEFKRRIHVGQRVTVVNHLHSHASGERTVHKVEAQGLKTKSEGAKPPWFVKWPRKGAWRIERDTLHFLDETDPERVVFSYTFHFDTKEQTEPEETSVRTRYTVNWRWTERPEKSRRSSPMVDSAHMTRPGDPEQRDQLIRVQLANLLPIGQGPENVILDTVIPICNCEPFPEPANCLYATHKGKRFYLMSTSNRGEESIVDRHGDKVLGTVAHTLSVEFLTMVREKYGHQ